jgi:uncharacterized protein YjbJ (UPF0337 family)
MAWDYIEGKWKEMRGKVRERWGKLTDDDLDVIAGKRDQLVGIIQQRYGLQRTRLSSRSASSSAAIRVPRVALRVSLTTRSGAHRCCGPSS